jgi:hypothetical protein
MFSGNVTSTTAVAQPSAVHSGQQSNQEGGGSTLAAILIVAVVVFFVLARMLRGAFAMVGNLFSSAGSVFAVLIGLIGVGTLLLTAVIMVFVSG